MSADLTVRDTASVTVSKPVDGTRHYRARATDRRPRTAPVQRQRVDPAVMAQARRIMRPGQRLVIVSPSCVRLVNVPHDG